MIPRNLTITTTVIEIEKSSKLNCCKQCRFGQVKGTVTKTNTLNNTQITRRNIQLECFIFLIKLFCFFGCPSICIHIILLTLNPLWRLQGCASNKGKHLPMEFLTGVTTWITVTRYVNSVCASIFILHKYNNTYRLFRYNPKYLFNLQLM